jgi:hypothetical protein
MTDTPEWLDQQTQERLQKLEVSVTHQKVLVNRLAEDTEVIRSRQNTVLKGLGDIQNTLKFQKWLLRVSVSVGGVLLWSFGKITWDDVSAIAQVYREPINLGIEVPGADTISKHDTHIGKE